MSYLWWLFCFALDVYFVILLLRIVLSWVPSLPEPLLPAARFLRAMTDPLLVPLRGVLPPVQMGTMALDLSPILLFIAVRVVNALLCSRAPNPWG